MIHFLLMLVALCGMALAVGISIFLLQRYLHPDLSPIHQRLLSVKTAGKAEEAGPVSSDYLDMTHLYRDSVYQNEALGQRLEHIRLFRNLRQAMVQAGEKKKPDQYFMTNLVIPFLLFAALGMVTKFFLFFLVGLGISVWGYFSIMLKRQKRFNRIITQMPDALSMMVNALRAGHALPAALNFVSTELSDPIGGEFANMVSDLNLGVPIKEAIGRLLARVDNLPDLCMFSTAVLVQREVGGNLAEVLEKLSYTIRERFKLKGQISALTGQSRLTGYVLGVAPLVLLSGLSILMYGYVKPLWETGLGHLCLVAVFFLQAVGFIVMRKIIDIRV